MEIFKNDKKRTPQEKCKRGLYAVSVLVTMFCFCLVYSGVSKCKGESNPQKEKEANLELMDNCIDSLLTELKSYNNPVILTKNPIYEFEETQVFPLEDSLTYVKSLLNMIDAINPGDSRKEELMRTYNRLTDKKNYWYENTNVKTYIYRTVLFSAVPEGQTESISLSTIQCLDKDTGEQHLRMTEPYSDEVVEKPFKDEEINK